MSITWNLLASVNDELFESLVRPADLSKLLVVVVVVHGVIAPCLELLHLLDRHPEYEDVVLAHLLRHLHVGAVQGPDGQGAVQHELHIASSARTMILLQ